MSATSLRLMVAAGEPSGDAHAAALVSAIKALTGAGSEFFGSTGPEMRAAGVETIVNADTLAIMGLVEVTRAFPRFWRAFKALKRAAVERHPDAVILVDWPEFNLRLARSLHRQGIRIIYYISPQVWAWRSYRVRNIRRDVDLLLSILPFEQQWYSKRGIRDVRFVGHPLAGEVRPAFGREEFCRRHKLISSNPLIALLPGSREKEIERILPSLLDAASIIANSHPEIQYVIGLARSSSRKKIVGLMNSWRQRTSPFIPEMTIVHGETIEALAAANVAAIASGTATLQATLTQTPMVIVYKESSINWHTLGRLITAEHFGLANLIAGERIVLELFQNELNGERLASELLSLVEPERNQAMRTKLREVSAQLGPGGASKRAAEAVLTAVNEWRASL